MAHNNSNERFLDHRARRPVSTLHEWSRQQSLSDRLFNAPADISMAHCHTGAPMPELFEPPLSPRSIVSSNMPLPPHSEAGETYHSGYYSHGSSSLPGLTNTSTIHAVSEIDERDTLPIQGVLQLIPDGETFDYHTVAENPVFTCRFYFLNCNYHSTNENEWREHTLSHLRGHPPPSSLACPLCDMTFNIPNPNLSWAANMSHLAQHIKDGHSMATARPDFGMFRYLWAQRIICDVDYQELMGNYTLAHGRRPYVMHERRDRKERRGRPMPPSRM